MENGHPLHLSLNMKPVMKARWYVWIFCCLLASTLHTMSKGHTVVTSRLEPSFFVFYDGIVAPLLCVFIVFPLIRQTPNWIERTVLILMAFGFVLGAVSVLHQLNYIAISTMPQVSHWSFVLATVLLGYRTDQVLKYQDRRIETISCSTPL
jgi:hypothetical protein